jgi:hypothetical protein
MGIQNMIEYAVTGSSEVKERDKYANVLKEIKGNQSSHRRKLGSIPGQPI